MDPSYGGACAACVGRGRRGAGGAGAGKNGAGGESLGALGRSSPLSLTPRRLSFLSLLEKTWRVLEAAIHEINNHNASGLSFEELYR